MNRTRTRRGRAAQTAAGEDFGNCPECGAKIAVITGKDAGVVHAMPICAKFKDMNALTYLQWVNRTREASRRPVAEA